MAYSKTIPIQIDLKQFVENLPFETLSELQQLIQSRINNKNIDLPVYDDLDELAGTWIEADEKQFSHATQQFNQIDTTLWQ
jgi:hypothetical protein